MKKRQLTLSMAIAYRFTPRKCVKYYFPESTTEEQDFLLFEETCYPMCMKTTLQQLYSIYTKNQ